MHAPTTHLPLTPRAQRVIEIARQEATNLNQREVGTEHLMVALMLEPSGVAGQALRNLGLKLHLVAPEVLKIRIAQMKIVERAVRPVQASTARKRKMREELLAHLTEIFEEELASTRNPAAALDAAAKRFGDPSELAGELSSALPWMERVGFHYRALVWVARPGIGRAIFVPASKNILRSDGDRRRNRRHGGRPAGRLGSKHLASNPPRRGDAPLGAACAILAWHVVLQNA